MEQLGPYRLDAQGNRWINLGPAKPRRVCPVEGVPVEPMPDAEPLTTGAAAFADACRLGPCLDHLIGNAKRRTAAALVARLEEHGATFRVNAGTLWVGPPALLDDEARAIIPLVKAEIMALVAERAAVPVGT